MTQSGAATAAEPGHKVQWKAVALPTEHGGWGLIGEPALLGLVLAPSLAGVALVVASLGGFLARHPLKLALSDRRRGTRTARTVLAEKLVLAYVALVLGSAAAAFGLGGLRPLLPLAAVAPLALVQLAYDARLQGRRLAPELAGAAALSSLAPALLLAGGWAAAPAIGAGLLMAAKASATVLYVRARLRLDRGQESQGGVAVAAHVAAGLVAALLAAADWAPWLGLAATVGLALRAAHGLSRFHRVVKPRVVGFQELGFGIAFTAALAAGYAGGW